MVIESPWNWSQSISVCINEYIFWSLYSVSLSYWTTMNLSLLTLFICSRSAKIRLTLVFSSNSSKMSCSKLGEIIYFLHPLGQGQYNWQQKLKTKNTASPPPQLQFCQFSILHTIMTLSITDHLSYSYENYCQFLYWTTITHTGILIVSEFAYIYDITYLELEPFSLCWIGVLWLMRLSTF